MGTFYRNLETDKIVLTFDKSEYLALPDTKKKEIKSAYLWSNYAGGWVSRTKGRNTYHAEQIAKSIGLVYEGEKGERLTFAEQIEREQERAEARADRFETRAEKAEAEGVQAYKKAVEIGSYIPMGQPILVGHHSEARHRRDIDRIDNSMRKSVESSEKAEYYEDRAEIARRTAEGARFKDVKYLQNRLDEVNAKLRELARMMEGKDMYDKETGERMVNGCEISDERRAYLTKRIDEEREKLDFYTQKMTEAGGATWTPERLKEERVLYIQTAQYRGEWWPVKSINRDTVTVLNWLDIAHFTWKFKINTIKAVSSEPMVVTDRSGNEVKPTIKYK